MDAKLIRYYKRKMFGGRSIVARFVDGFMLRFVLLFIIFIAILYFSRSLWAAILISVFITAAVSLLLTLMKRKRVIRFIEKDTVRIKQKCLLETLTMMDAEEYVTYISQLYEVLTDIQYTDDGFTAKSREKQFYVFHNHPGSVCGIESVLKVARQFKGQNVVIVTLSDFSDAAKTFCEGNGIRMISGKSVLQKAEEQDMLPDEEDAMEKARKEMSESIITMEKFKNSAFSRAKIKAYIFCGLVVMCWPFVMGFRIYYPIIAIACFVMAAVTYRKNRPREESHDVGIS